jgi:hypothetical protein
VRRRQVDQQYTGAGPELPLGPNMRSQGRIGNRCARNRRSEGRAFRRWWRGNLAPAPHLEEAQLQTQRYSASAEQEAEGPGAGSKLHLPP